MTAGSLNEVVVYPLKSAGGIRVGEANVVVYPLKSAGGIRVGEANMDQ